MSVNAQVLHDLREAGLRGMTRTELRRRYGSHYNRRLRDLEAAGHVLNRHRSRYGDRSWWRIVLTLEAQPQPQETEPDQAELVLDCSGKPPPVNALFADLAA